MIYDVCIIGAGVNGSSAAYSLSKQHKNVLLVEQFPVPHTRGSSHGQSRIIRCLYPQEIYAKMTFDAFPIWKQLQKDVGEKLLIQNGMLEIVDPNLNPKKVVQCQRVLETLGVKYDVMTGDEVNTKYPLFTLPSHYSAIFEHHGGMVMASKCVSALQKMFVKNGGIFHDGEMVAGIIPGSIVTIKTSKGEYKAKSVIVSAGSFTSKLTKSLGLNLPLKVERTHACYWKLKDPNLGTTKRFPSFKALHDTYGLAACEYPGLIKICNHWGSEVDIDHPDKEVKLTKLAKFIKEFTTGIEHKPSIVESCLYTITPDHNFILDSHPKFSNIVIGAGFSGTGFKMAPVTGNILADLALGKTPEYDMSLFRMSRFHVVLDIKASL